MKLTLELFSKISPLTPKSTAPKVVEWFNFYNDKYCVNSPIRVASFLSQLMHESNRFKVAEEYASGAAYEGRTNLGNTQKGDGVKFKGRGYIQITGRSNYEAVSKFMFGDNRLLLSPMDLMLPQYAMLSAFWYWDSRKLNDLADKNYLKTITKRINGGLNGWDDRLMLFNHIADILGIPHWTE